jgi:NAD(P)-dependent dehydrogenase (short-subunit alcohol dehydrogenase family)
MSGRRAIITGAGAGIGRAIALDLATGGWNLGLCDLDESALAETAAQVAAIGAAVHTAPCDVSRQDSVRAAAVRLLDGLGGVDLLVNNAGILRTDPFLQTTADDWRTVLSVNLDGAFHWCQAVLPAMIAAGAGGSVINMASWTGKKGVPNHAAYCASKFALIGLTQVLAGEMATHSIRVNAICPGIIVETRMRDTAEALNRSQGLPDVAARVQNQPIRRPGTPDDLTGVVRFLASDAAGYMTGQAINVTGGLWMS